MKLSTLDDWLAWIGSVHNKEIDLGLDRVKAVAARLNLVPSCPLIIVGGTNGKGSTVAALESIYRAQGYQTGAFTSPVLFKHNEQVRINGAQAKDDEFCQAFEKIEAVRGEITLTPFEYHTLAALCIFKHYPLDIWILEVGLGGRLDAVNILDADVAIVTSISLDHTEWLGSTREDIAREKAGIFRHGKPAICGDFDPPASLIETATKVGAELYSQSEQFYYQQNISDWSWQYSHIRYNHLPFNALAMQNMSSALMAITLLQKQLPVQEEAIKNGLKNVSLIGRIQIIEGPIQEIFDVSHNPGSVALLAERLKTLVCAGKTHGVFSMLADKDISTSVKLIKNYINEWYVAPLSIKRAASKEVLENSLHQAQIDGFRLFDSIERAYEQARKQSKPDDRIIIFGSFHTVAEVMQYKDSTLNK